MKNANYRKHDDRTQNSSTYHKKDGTNTRAILKEDARKEADQVTGKAVRMKERGILFNAEMVRAILAGRKTQTRRIAKEVTEWHTQENPLDSCVVKDGVAYCDVQVSESDVIAFEFPCPFGKVGDRLYVRETWADLRGMGFDDQVAYREKSLKDYGRGLEEDGDSERCRLDFGVKWKPSIHMPRWASRITLEITGVRVERLNDISEEDAEAEGVTPCDDPRWNPTQALELLWESINGPGSWSVNPWVWAVDFRRVE